MRKLFGIINRGKSILFVSFFALAATNGSFILALLADKISIDFSGKEILASDLAPYTDLLNIHCSSVNYENLSPDIQGRMRKWLETTEISDFKKMPLNEVMDRIRKVCEKTVKRGGNIMEFARMKVKSVLQVDWAAENLSSFIHKPLEDAIKISEKRGCIHSWEADENKDNSKDKDNSVTFHLKNGKISSAESQKLFAGLELPLRLVFENVQGTLAKNDTLKQRIVSMEFRNCNLTLEENCFRNAEKLERVYFYSSNVRLNNGAFANCKNFEHVQAENSKLLCLPPDTVFEVFGGSLKPESIRELIALNLLCLCREPLSDKRRILDFLQCNGIDIAFSSSLRQAMIEKEKQTIREEIEKEFKSREQECNSIEKENRRLKNANQNLQDQMKGMVQKNKTLREELKNVRQTCEGLSKEYSQLKSECKTLKKVHAEAIEKSTKELEKSRSDCSSAGEKLEKYKTSLNIAEEALRALRETNEEQKEEIESLKAFKSQWEAKILTLERLETEKDELSKQLENAKKNESNSKRMLEKERAQNKEELNKKQADIGNSKKELKSLALELAETQKVLSDARAKIKELENSETHILTTVGGILSDDEDKKEEEKNNAFRSEFVSKKNFKNYLPTPNRKKNKVWKNFEYPKNNK